METPAVELREPTEAEVSLLGRPYPEGELDRGLTLDQREWWTDLAEALLYPEGGNAAVTMADVKQAEGAIAQCRARKGA